MLFNSLEFALFLTALLGAHFLLVPASWVRTRKVVLLVASYIFYGSWNPPFVLLLAFSTLLDFLLASRMEKTSRLGRRRALLSLSLAGNLGMLGYFKYGGFLTEQFYVLFGPWLTEPAPTGWDIVLPVGISFYTFQTLSYSIDVYRGRLAPTRSLLDFALYVSFFPQLVAGPIVRASDFLPQLQAGARRPAHDVAAALGRIGGGVVKKVVLADTLGSFVDPVFAAPGDFGAFDVLIAVYAYAYQIYFDFSGYSDIAIGLAALFGFRIPENFDRPYLATNPREFWQRWHISLSTWLRDYLYVSLGGNRRGPARTYLNLLITMLLGGLWHGAAWNFLIWGGFHGAWLWVHRWWSKRRPAREGGMALQVSKRVATFHGVCAAWVFFRAADFEAALTLFARLADWGALNPRVPVTAVIALGLALTIHVTGDSEALRRRWRQLPPTVQGAGLAAVVVLAFFFSPATTRFIYFQF
jgi:alginate O-acetyltransferase complex protein AlgI